MSDTGKLVFFSIGLIFMAAGIAWAPDDKLLTLACIGAMLILAGVTVIPALWLKPFSAESRPQVPVLAQVQAQRLRDGVED